MHQRLDPRLNVLYVNMNEAPTIGRLRPVYGAGGGEEWNWVGRSARPTACRATAPICGPAEPEQAA